MLSISSRPVSAPATYETAELHTFLNSLFLSCRPLPQIVSNHGRSEQTELRMADVGEGKANPGGLHCTSSLGKTLSELNKRNDCTSSGYSRPCSQSHSRNRTRHTERWRSSGGFQNLGPRVFPGGDGPPRQYVGDTGPDPMDRNHVSIRHRLLFTQT